MIDAAGIFTLLKSLTATGWLLLIILLLLLFHIWMSHKKHNENLEEMTYMSMRIVAMDTALEHESKNGYKISKEEKFNALEKEYLRKNKKDKRNITINILKMN